jgi:WD40 repeat protein
VSDLSVVMLQFPELLRTRQEGGRRLVEPRTPLALTLMTGLVTPSGSEHLEVYRALRARAVETLVARDESDAFVAAQLPRQARGSLALEDLLKDALAVLCSDPYQLVAEIESSAHTVLHPGGKTVLLAAHQLAGRYDRASHLELTAHRVGLTAFAGSIGAAVPDRGWTAVWARSRPVNANRIVARCASPVLSVAQVVDDPQCRFVAACSDGRLWVGSAYEPARLLWDGSHRVGELRACDARYLDGTSLVAVVTSDQRVLVVDVDTGKLLREDADAHAAPLSAVALGRSGGRRIVASAGVDGLLHIVSLQGPPEEEARVARRLTIQDLPIEVRSVQIVDGDPALVVHAGVDGTVGIIDAATGETMASCPTDLGVLNAMALWADPDRPERIVLVVGAASGIVARITWNAIEHAWDRPLVLMEHAAAVNAVDLVASPHGLTVIAAASDTTWSAIDLDRTGEPLPAEEPLGEPVSGHFAPVWGITVLPRRDSDGWFVVTGGGEGVCRLWVPEAVRRESLVLERPTRHGGSVTSVHLTEDDGTVTIVTGGADGQVRLWHNEDASSGRALEEAPSAIRALAMLPVEPRPGGEPDEDCVLLAGAAHGSIIMMRMRDGQVVRKEPLGISQEGVTAFAVARLDDRRLLVSGGLDGSLALWDPDRVVPQTPLARHEALHFGPVTALAVLGYSAAKVRLAAATQDGTISIRRLPDLTEAGSHRLEVSVTDIAALPHQESGLVAGLVDGRIAYSTTGAWRYFHAHQNDVAGLSAFVISGRVVVVSAGLDRRLCLWDLATEQLLQELELDGLPLALHTVSPYTAVATTAGAAVFRFSEDPLLLTARSGSDDG